MLFVDYPLAPGYTYPTQNEDCFAVYRRAADNAERLEIDASRIAVCGDSAGAYLAADTARMLAEKGMGTPCFPLYQWRL